MGLLTFGLNLTLDGCYDHREGIADDELHDHFTQLMEEAGAMLWGRTTYEMMESFWPAVARDENAPRAMRDWAQKLRAARHGGIRDDRPAPARWKDNERGATDGEKASYVATSALAAKDALLRFYSREILFCVGRATSLDRAGSRAAINRRPLTGL